MTARIHNFGAGPGVLPESVLRQAQGDIWDIGGITAFFGLSNRMANLIGMRPNDEFFLMGRQPRPPRA